MQIIENWSDIEGSVLSCTPSPDVAGFSVVEVAVTKVSPVEGFANLLENSEGESLTLLVPEDMVASAGIAPGVHIVCRVRRANLNRVFVHRDHLSVQHAEK